MGKKYKLLRLAFFGAFAVCAILAVQLLGPSPVSAKASQPANPEQNARIVKAALETSVITGRPDDARKYFSNSLLIHLGSGIPYGRDYHGFAGFLELQREVKTFWSEVHLNDREIISLPGNRVMIHYNLDGVVAKSGKRAQMPVVAIWELRNSRIVEMTIFYFDTKKIFDLSM